MDEQFKHAIALIKHCHRGGTFGMFWWSQGKRSRWYAIGGPAGLPTDANTYFGVSPSTCIPATNSQGQPAQPEAVATQNRYIAVVNCLFAEFDAKDFGGDKLQALDHIQNLQFSSSFIVDSGGGFHCYWFFEQPVTIEDEAMRDKMTQAQADWVLWVGGDKGAKDLRRVLRVPGTFNAKYDPPRRVEVIDANGYLYESSLLLEMCALYVQPFKRSEALGNVGKTIVPARSYDSDSIISRFLREHTPADILRKAGYTVAKGENRFTRPDKKPQDGISGTITESGGKLRAFTFSSSDKLFEENPNGKRHQLDAFDLFVKLEHGGDLSAAIKAAAEEQGRPLRQEVNHGDNRTSITI